MIAIASVANKPDAPAWLVAIVLFGLFFELVRGARTAERRRRVQNQPHTTKDSLLLFVAGVIVVALLLCTMLIDELHPVVESRLVVYTVIFVVGGTLTYLFNRNGKRGDQ